MLTSLKKLISKEIRKTIGYGKFVYDANRSGGLRAKRFGDFGSDVLAEPGGLSGVEDGGGDLGGDLFVEGTGSPGYRGGSGLRGCRVDAGSGGDGFREFLSGVREGKEVSGVLSSHGGEFVYGVRPDGSPVIAASGRRGKGLEAGIAGGGRGCPGRRRRGLQANWGVGVVVAAPGDGVAHAL